MVATGYRKPTPFKMNAVATGIPPAGVAGTTDGPGYTMGTGRWGIGWGYEG